MMAKSKKNTDSKVLTSVAKRKTQTKKKRRQKPFSAMSRCTSSLLCFDSETTNHGELLELSVFDAAGVEVYHKYFRPHAKTWPSDIHHISPEMVADCKRFIAHRGEISRMLNDVKYLLGCAISNDIHNLRRHGVNLNERHIAIDIQTWFWLLKDSTDRREKYQTGLAAIGQAYGLDFGEEKQHSATADTRLTLACFQALVDDFNRQFPDLTGEEPNISDERYLGRLITRFKVEYKKALQVYKMRNAGGYVSVIKREQGYSLKFHRLLPEDCSRYVMSIKVGDRNLAEQELRHFLKSRELKGLTGIYDLQEAEFEFLRNYTNEMDEVKYIASKTSNRQSESSRSVVKAVRRALSLRTASPKQNERVSAQKNQKKKTKSFWRKPKRNSRTS